MRVVGAGLALALLGGTAEAQLSGGQWRLPPQPSGARGVEVKSQPAPVVDPTSPFGNPSFPRHAVAFTLVPAILMSDGSIFANFGFGYEPVLRPCSGVVDVGQPRRIAGNGFVLSEPKRLPYTQPVPQQQYTASQQIHSSSQRVALSAAAQLSCFNRDAAGRVFVFRRI